MSRIFQSGLLLISFVWNSAVLAQICNTESIVASTPNNQLQDNGDGTVTDNKTGLMWIQCLVGQSGIGCTHGDAETYSWSAALLRVQAINSGSGFAGYTDWRLPNIKELSSLIESQCTFPSINLMRFPGSSNNHVWSSSAMMTMGEGATGRRWIVEFGMGLSGASYIGDGDHQLRLVRNTTHNASWTFNSETGHHYKRVSCGSWKECESKAVVEGAHLVTINSAEENTWLIQTFGSDYLWIGFTDENSEGNWRWVSGEAVTYTNWADAEPNNLYIENQSHFTDGGKWNDLDGDRTEYTTDAIWEKN